MIFGDITATGTTHFMITDGALFIMGGMLPTLIIDGIAHGITPILTTMLTTIGTIPIITDIPSTVMIKMSIQLKIYIMVQERGLVQMYLATANHLTPLGQATLRACPTKVT